MQPEQQGQHRVSEVYLKQFAFEEKGDLMISTLKIGSREITQQRINDFTKEVNIFDLPFKEMADRRKFETNSNKIESRYNTIISNLKNQHRLIPKDKDYLNHFVANLMCRTDPFRKRIEFMLHHKTAREKFLNEITMFEDIPEKIKLSLNILKESYQLNVAITVVMDHLVRVFRSFSNLILKEEGGEGWLTTDSPVYFDEQDSFDHLIPIEAEIYLPLSPDYCLFMYHDKATKNTNPLRSLAKDKVNNISFKEFDLVANKIARDFNEYLIFSTYTPSQLINSNS